jgi:hypothetical protein
MACPEVPNYTPPVIESKRQRTFDLMFNLDTTTKEEPLVLAPPQSTRTFTQEKETFHLQADEISYLPKTRQLIVSNAEIKTDVERIYVEIAKYSRQLDYLMNVNLQLDAFLDPDKKDKWAAHPLSKTDCFKKNEVEFVELNKFLK